MMRETVLVDASEFPRLTVGTRQTLWWGFIGLVLIEITVIAGLLAAYFYLMLRNPQWPPPGVAPLDLVYPSIALVLLLVSCLTMHSGRRALSANRQSPFLVNLFLSAALATVVLVLHGLQFTTFEFTWRDHAYGSMVWTLTGIHILHAAAATSAVVVLGILGTKGYFTPERQSGIQAFNLYWYLFALSWIPFYLVLYWTHR